MYLIDRNIDNLIKLTKYFAMFNKCQWVIALIICRYRWAWEWYRWSIIWLHYLSWTLLTHSDTLDNGRCATRSQATLYTAGQLCTQPCYVTTHSSAHLPCWVLTMAASLRFAFGCLFIDTICNRHTKAIFIIARLFGVRWSYPCVRGRMLFWTEPQFCSSKQHCWAVWHPPGCEFPARLCVRLSGCALCLLRSNQGTHNSTRLRTVETWAKVNKDLCCHLMPRGNNGV